MSKIKVLINGAAGKMGREVVKAVSREKDLEVIAAVDKVEVGIDAGALVGINPLGVEVSSDLGKAIKSSKPDVVVDFTHPNVVMDNVRTILNSRVHAVVGTTGIAEDGLGEIGDLCKKNKVNCLVAPNFAIGAVLMMRFAAEASKHLPKAEIVELHHDRKADAPSGTAIKTAEMMLEERSKHDTSKKKTDEIEKLDGARGGEMGGIHIHSVRLPGFVAHQEVIFGGLGQTLRIKHDSISRESFMPGVVMAVRKISKLKGLTYGLEGIL
jgi:4-hydroxy-tetrahydrodipicolinate reductase